jgi:hypothetical protein
VAKGINHIQPSSGILRKMFPILTDKLILSQHAYTHRLPPYLALILSGCPEKGYKSRSQENIGSTLNFISPKNIWSEF